MGAAAHFQRRALALRRWRAVGARSGPALGGARPRDAGNAGSAVADIFDVPLDPDSLRAVHDASLLGGAVRLVGQTRAGAPLPFIPDFLWGNRGPAGMTVFVCV